MLDVSSNKFRKNIGCAILTLIFSLGQKSRRSDLALEKYWITKCGWLRLYMPVATVIAIKSFLIFS